MVLLLFILAACFAAAFAADGFGPVLRGFVEIQIHPARLINDYIEIAGIGPALFNAAAVGLVGLLLILITKIGFSGPTFAAVFTMMGFGLFGKTPVNILPIIAGVYLSGRLVGKQFSEYIIIALFGTALGPLVSFFASEAGFSGIPGILLGGGVGILTGFFLPAIAVSMLHLHQGYNLYNMGFSCGFFALFIASLLKAIGRGLPGGLQWYSGSSLLLSLFVPVLSLFLVLAGIIIGKKSLFRDFIFIQKQSGRLPSDFMEMKSAAGSLLNAGLLGMLGSLYIIVIGGHFSGPVIGGLLTVIGFGTFGTHLRNSWTVVGGVLAATFLFGRSPAEPGPILAFLFSTTLAPLAGQFGIFAGFLAGFIHLVMVLQTGAWHGGMNLYNNGFAGGLTATLIVSVIQWYRNNKAESE